MHVIKNANGENLLTEGENRPNEKSYCIADFRDFAKDYAKIVSVLNAGSVYYVYSRVNGTKYKIFNVSVFDPTIDDGKTFIQVSGRQMQDATLFFLQFSRDTMANLRIFSTKNKSYLVEPRIEALTWTAKRLGLTSRKELSRVIVGGGLQDIFVSDAKKIKRKHKESKKLVDNERPCLEKFDEAERLETELANLRIKELAILQKLGNENLLYSKHKDERIRWQDERIAQLRRFINENGLEVPGPITTQNSRYTTRAQNKN